MPRPTSVQITRDRRKDGSVTFGLRVRAGGADERVGLGNSREGWDETRVEQARRQLRAKIELGLWTPRRPGSPVEPGAAEPTFRELATDWLEGRRRNPALRPRTIELNEWQLTRYLTPFFGELLPSQITPSAVKLYRQRIHAENARIREAAEMGRPLRDPRSAVKLRTLSNESINKTLQVLAAILDEAEDSGWVERNVARGRRTREPLERRRHRGVLDVDEFLAILEAAQQLDNRHLPRTLERAEVVRVLRDSSKLSWKQIAARLQLAPATAIYLYGCKDEQALARCGVRRAILVTLGLAGLRVGELGQLDNQDVSLAKSRLYIRDAKTEAGIRTVDIHPRLQDELTNYYVGRDRGPMDTPAFPTRKGTRHQRDNVLRHVVQPALARANELRAHQGQPPILVHVTPHTFRRTYVTYMVAAGYDLPYVQAQVGHLDPTTTLAIYAQTLTRQDRDELRSEIRQLLGTEAETPRAPSPAVRQLRQGEPHPTRLAVSEKAGKGRGLHL